MFCSVPDFLFSFFLFTWVLIFHLAFVLKSSFLEKKFSSVFFIFNNKNNNYVEFLLVTNIQCPFNFSSLFLFVPYLRISSSCFQLYLLAFVVLVVLDEINTAFIPYFLKTLKYWNSTLNKKEAINATLFFSHFE